MPFLTENDYKVQIRQWIKNMISSDDPAILELAEQSAQEEMEQYLSSRFDVAKIFNPDQAPEDRNQLVVMYMIDIAIYHLHANITPNDVPEVRQIRYDNAMRWLQKVNRSELTPNLPKLVSEGEEGSTDNALFFEGGSNESYTTRY